MIGESVKIVLVKIMKDLSKKNKIIITLGGAGLLLLGAVCNDMITKLVKLDEEENTIRTTTKCAESSVYISEKDRNVYTYCLESIEINDGGKYVDFKDYYKEHDDALERLIERMETKDTFKDGGSTLYVNERSDLAILTCNTLNGNKDMYIGPKDMGYEEGFCENRYSAINTKNFEIVYSIVEIEPHNDEKYKFVTLYEPNGIEVETVVVEATFAKSLKRDKTYTFKFESENIPFESHIKNVFHEARVVEVVEIKK